jgi:hypothetical protein
MLVSIAGCQKGNGALRPAGAGSPAAMLASNLGGRSAAVDTSGNGMIKQTVFDVTADVNKLSTASAVEQKRLLPAHISAVNGMLDRFETKVRAMHVKVDPDWVAVIDSVRSDVAKMPHMSAEQLHAFLPEHNRRVMRIVACVDMARL